MVVKNRSFGVDTSGCGQVPDFRVHINIIRPLITAAQRLIAVMIITLKIICYMLGITMALRHYLFIQDYIPILIKRWNLGKRLVKDVIKFYQYGNQNASLFSLSF